MRRSVLFWQLLLVLAAGTLGVVFLLDPVAGWLPGQARKSPAPPVLGVGGIVVPIVALGYVGYRAWFELSLRRAARAARRRS